ncbi:ATPase [Brucella endophytica]|uniref:ATPase n=1 Tax=Brucella endophytica TaxID=1963359 RepID=A0A916WFV8_9HYPH|nr:BadF/BadG/BcrA/BcrD ATPase family protein [Brucella endophytica]GGA93847.1 ATPase [Brucella endophytica]
MLVGIDIGGTKTHLLANENRKLVGERILPTGQWRGRFDDEADASALVNLVTATAEGKPPTVTVIGAHGCDSDEDRLALQIRLARRLPGKVLVLNDSELLLPAAGKTSGISVISGTGSIAVSRDDQRRMLAAGGWGWYLGDDGSASGMVREAARAVRASIDEGDGLEDLGDALMRALAVSSPIELGRALGEIGSAAGIGRFAPLIFSAADAGSELARKVIGHAGGALARLAEQLVRRGAPTTDIVTGGGVISRQRGLFEAFQAALAERLPGASLTLLHEPPVHGAIQLARMLDAAQLPENLPIPHADGLLMANHDGRAA